MRTDRVDDAGTSAAPTGALATNRASRIPRAVAEARVAPSVAAAQSAIAEASRVTGTESPADAGATFARRSTSTPEPGWVEAQPTTPLVVRVQRKPETQPEARPASRPETRPAAVTATTSSEPREGTGAWKVQLGAFAVDGNAEKLWARLSGRSELAGASRIIKPSGRVNVLLAGGYASRADAQNACNALKRSGQDCLVTR